MKCPFVEMAKKDPKYVETFQCIKHKEKVRIAACISFDVYDQRTPYQMGKFLVIAGDTIRERLETERKLTPRDKMPITLRKQS